MNKLIIDIGNHTTRALLYNSGTRITTPVHLALNNELLTPSVAVFNEDNQIVAIGEEALLWKQTNPEIFFHLEDITSEECFAAFILHVCRAVIKKVRGIGQNIDALVVTTPPNRDMLGSACIDRMKKKLRSLSIHSFVVKNTYEHIIQRSYNVNNGEYVLLYDIGYTHTTIVLAKKTESGIKIVSQTSSGVLSGQIIDSLLFEDIESKLTLPDYDDLTIGLLYNSALEQTIEHIKRKFSEEESFDCPIPNADCNYECSRTSLESMMSKQLADSFSLVSQLMRDSQINVTLIKQVIMYGATCRLPFIEQYLRAYLASNLKINMNEIKNIATHELHSELYGCKAAINL